MFTKISRFISSLRDPEYVRDSRKYYKKVNAMNRRELDTEIARIREAIAALEKEEKKLISYAGLSGRRRYEGEYVHKD